MRVPEPRTATPRASVSTPEFRAAVETAAANIRALRRNADCRANGSTQLKPGLQLGQIVRPLDTVAAYIPARPLSAALHR